MNTLFLLLTSLAVVLAWPAVANAAGDVRAGRTISVSGTGYVDAKPDVAIFTSGVVTEDATAAAAISANSKAVANLIDGLKAQGIASGDIQTSQFSVNPRYEQSSQSAPRISGFEGRNSVTVTVRDIATIGTLLDAAAKLGANQFGGISFIVSTADTLLDDARANAIASARRQAEIYAKAAGVKLGQVLSISEAGQDSGPRPMIMGRAMAAEAVPIEGGTNRLSTTVTVVWELD